MNNLFKKQITLFKKRMLIRNILNPLRFSEPQQDYLRDLLKKEKRNIFLLFCFILLMSGIEIILPVALDFFWDFFGFNLDTSLLLKMLPVLIVIVVMYLILSYFTIGKQKRISLNIINKIREDWIKIYLDKPFGVFKTNDLSNVYVKISYHLSLLQSGLNNTFFNVFQWLIYVSGILIISAIIDVQVLYISLLFLVGNFIVLAVSYVLSAYYLAKDQTLYSRLLRYISTQFSNINFIKLRKGEGEVVGTVSEIVELDNYFRIKREIVLKIGNKVIFALFTLGSALIYVVEIYYPSLIISQDTQSVVQILVFALHARLLYLSLRIGLYYFPLKLGLILTTPSFTPEEKESEEELIHSITFRAKKVKLSQDDDYRKNLEYSFDTGKRYLIQDTSAVKSNPLQHLIMGSGSKNFNQNWQVIVNGTKRLNSQEWNRYEKSLFLIHSDIYDSVDVFNFIGRPDNLLILKKYKFLGSTFKKMNNLGSVVSHNKNAFKDMFVLQVAYCLLVKPRMIIIDPLVYDLPYSYIQEGYNLLHSELRDSIIICSTFNDAISKKYDVIYKI